MTLIMVGIHVFVCLFLIFVVLLQSAQAADLAGAFGGGGSQTALGMRGATTLFQKATTAAAVVFMLTSLSLGMMGRASSSLIEGLDAPAGTAPEGGAQPGADAEQASDVAPATGEEQAGEGASEQGSEGAEQGSEGEEPGSGTQQEQQ